ncbi:glycosyltransferase [Bacillus mangrovi]|uniref:Glycosyltransferase n=1 Tax=Metabacillus mangrovi TaxID=1491830 RepID=A0A7X2S7J8_9BACI|nr:glycosyltransferase [Metabacillus mangrovi]MTH54276.1 glycosyltransferase [Metabacillus mangrovi]
MNITILTTGTRGDTQPYLALGKELQLAGAKVKVAAFENFEAFVREAGLDYHPIKGDVSQLTQSDLVEDAMKADHPIKFFRSFRKLMPLMEGLQKDFYEACIGADAIVYHPGAALGYYIGQKLNIPVILASPFPMTPTKEYPALIFYDSRRLGRTYNWLTHKLFEKGMWMASKRPGKKFWEKELGPVPKNFTAPFSKQPAVSSISRHVFPRPKDWPEDSDAFGYWFHDHEKWTPPADLVQFLQAGKPPVYAGFGSVSNPKEAKETTRMILDALKETGQRGILATGWNGLAESEEIPEDVFILKSAPHSWLFPKMAAVIHHGGAGTTAEGLRAGIPSIIVPHSNDQFAWGRRVRELGVGPEPIRRKQLTAEKLTAAVNRALHSDIVHTAGELGEKIRKEQGAKEAAQFILHSLQKIR